MTDRELLEMAAKAARYNLEDHFDAHGLYWPWCIELEKNWCPLTDDGDALRLAVDLGLVVDCSRPSAGEPFKVHHYAQEAFSDSHAATRRAIVRAAAEIGKHAT